MDHPGLVRCLQHLGDLLCNRQGFIDRDRALGEKGKIPWGTAQVSGRLPSRRESHRTDDARSGPNPGSRTRIRC